MKFVSNAVDKQIDIRVRSALGSCDERLDNVDTGLVDSEENLWLEVRVVAGLESLPLPEHHSLRIDFSSTEHL